MGMKSFFMVMLLRVKVWCFEERRECEFVGFWNLSVERKGEMGLSGLVSGDEGGDEGVVEEDGRVGDVVEDRESVG